MDGNGRQAARKRGGAPDHRTNVFGQDERVDEKWSESDEMDAQCS